MSSIVSLEWINPTTAHISIQDLSSKNTLSTNIINQLENTINEINNNQNVKIVILSGLESNFCSGNSDLASPDVNKIHQLLLNCELPIIAALQGDALGEGLVLGAYADILIMAEESNYSGYNNSKNCTPESGAAYILPKKFGTLLGAELLYSTQPYTGEMLKNRNAPIRVVKKDRILSTAIELAKDFDEKLSVSLRLLKKHLAHVMKNEIQPYLK